MRKIQAITDMIGYEILEEYKDFKLPLGVYPTKQVEEFFKKNAKHDLCKQNIGDIFFKINNSITLREMLKTIEGVLNVLQDLRLITDIQFLTDLNSYKLAGTYYLPEVCKPYFTKKMEILFVNSYEAKEFFIKELTTLMIKVRKALEEKILEDDIKKKEENERAKEEQFLVEISKALRAV